MQKKQRFSLKIMKKNLKKIMLKNNFKKVLFFLKILLLNYFIFEKKIEGKKLQNKNAIKLVCGVKKGTFLLKIK